MRVCDVLFIIVCRGVAVGMPNDDHKLVPIDLLQEKRRILARKNHTHVESKTEVVSLSSYGSVHVVHFHCPCFDIRLNAR